MLYARDASPGRKRSSRVQRRGHTTRAPSHHSTCRVHRFRCARSEGSTRYTHEARFDPQLVRALEIQAALLGSIRARGRLGLADRGVVGSATTFARACRTLAAHLRVAHPAGGIAPALIMVVAGVLCVRAELAAMNVSGDRLAKVLCLLERMPEIVACLQVRAIARDEQRLELRGERGVERRRRSRRFGRLLGRA